MPHRCLGCGKRFEDGSKEILEGCPKCSGEKFLFVQEEIEKKFENPQEVDLEKIKKQKKKRQEKHKEKQKHKEIQKEKKEKKQQKQDKNTVYKKLGEQFEGVKIIEPGSYELNLTKLYERDEKIIALEEDGRYRVVFPESWIGDNKNK